MTQTKPPWTLSQQYSQFNISLALLCPVAVVLNMILLVKFFIHRRQLKNGYLILINICIADFICTSSLSLSSLLHTLSPELQWEWSQAAGMSITITAATSGVCAMFMSIERYMQIVLSRPLSTTQIISGIAITWVICIFVGFVPFLTETYYLVRPSEVWCFPGFTNPTIWHIPFIVLANILVWSGLIVIPLSYWSIYRFAVSNGFKWGLERGALEDDLSRKTALRSQLELTKKLSLLVFQFYVGWCGRGICFAYETATGTTYSPSTDYIFGMLHVISWVLNPLVVFTIDNRLKVHYKELFRNHIWR